MPESFVQVPADSSGKKLHTRQRTVGANTVEDEFTIPISQRVKTGIYIVSQELTVLAAAHTTTAGFFWLQNPVGSTVLVSLRRIDFMSQSNTALATPTAPRIGFRLATFTGTASGAVATLGKIDSTMATNTGTVRTAITGMTVTNGAIFTSFYPVINNVAAGAGATAPAALFWAPDEDGMIVLRAGEAVACTQLTAGTTSDTRVFSVGLTFEEYTLP